MDIFTTHIHNVFNIELAKELYPVCKKILNETKEDKRYCFGKTTFWQQDIMNTHMHEFSNFFKYINAESLKFMGLFELDIENPKIIINDFWLSEMYKGGSHALHVHSPKNHISGNFYIYAEPDSSNIIFTKGIYESTWLDFKRKKYTKYNSDEWTFPPEQGKLLMWESHLMHRVETNLSNSRIALTFNLEVIK
jgi:uncharacterized protein (TIGR02466 family)